ncbi:MAG: hypothetical protein JRJ09_17980 [Deltaproteobacteria bacterium]|nr:hypothetical protein [Deltaproteobacteria bacterium]MBW2111778.1 hypothetical protein [Deltaproteobacteria bacterium]MBW2354065.1 hypothetical protein [Deltaproteobacteria bacterium]HDZ89968.1 hypothetical protein [Deltaproteobacteria bacterium]
MTRCIYPMPEWLEESKKLYDSSFEKKLQKISGHYAYRIKAEPSWGIDKDLFQCSIMDAGKLIEMRFYTEEEAVKEADFIMAASAPVWKNILTKTDKFVAAFMARRIKLDKGNPVKALALGPYAGTMVDSLTQVELVFPDDLSPEEFGQFKAAFAEYRERAGV